MQWRDLFYNCSNRIPGRFSTSFLRGHVSVVLCIERILIGHVLCFVLLNGICPIVLFVLLSTGASRHSAGSYQWQNVIQMTTLAVD